MVPFASHRCGVRNDCHSAYRRYQRRQKPRTLTELRNIAEACSNFWGREEDFALMSRLKNHRICVYGHQTSLRLEHEIWYLLRRIAAECGATAVRLIEVYQRRQKP